MDVYTTNGNIIRHFPNEDGTTEIEFEFLFDDDNWSSLFSICSSYMAFYKQLKINYVVSNYTYTRVTVRQLDFTPEAQQQLIKSMLNVKAHANQLREKAQKHLIGTELEAVETNPSQFEELEQHKKREVLGKVFLKQFALAVIEREE